MQTLYELVGQYLELMEMAEEADDQVFMDTLDGIEGEIEEKAENYAKVIRMLDSDVECIDKEIKRLQEKKKTIGNNVKRIKESLYMAMVTTGKKKFKTALFSFGIQKNPASVSVEDEKLIPERFWKQQDPVLDKKLLSDFLKENGDMPYAKLVQTESLRIR